MDIIVMIVLIRCEVIKLICEGVKSIISADNRLDKEETERINREEELAVIELQNRILEIEKQKDIDRLAATRNSKKLYEEQFLFDCYDKFIESEMPNY